MGCLPVVAQESLGKKLDDKLSKRYYKSSYDTTYVVRPQEKWQTIGQPNRYQHPCQGNGKMRINGWHVPS